MICNMGLLLDSWFNIFIVFIFSVFIFLIDWSKKKLRYFEESKILHESFEFIPAFKDIITGQNMEDSFDSMYKRHPHSSYIGYYSFLEPKFLIRDPNLINNIMKSNFSKFHDRWRHGADEKHDPLAANLTNINGEKWKELRYKLSPGFTPRKLQWMFPLMQCCANSLAQRIRKTWTSPDEDVDAKQLFSSYTLATLASCGFGVEPDCIKDPKCEFRQMLNKDLDSSPFKIIKTLLKLYFPPFSFLKITPKDVEEYFVGQIKTEFQRRKNQHVRRNDFVELAMEIKEKGEIQHDSKELLGVEHLLPCRQTLDWTDEFLTSQLLMFFKAGFESSCQLVAIASYHLSKNTDVQDRLRREIRCAKLKHGTLNYQALKDVSLLDHCLSESLRLFPTTGLLMRVCTENFILEEGVVIKKGQTVVIPMRSIQLDEKYWSHPDKYEPERFTKGNITPGTYLPFGLGPKSCIGERFALLQAKLVIAKILENFLLLPSPKTKEPLKRGKWFNHHIEGGIWIRLQPIDLCSI